MRTYGKALLFFVLLALLLAFPRMVESPYALQMMILLFLAVAQGQSWNLIGGFAGQHSVGHAAYFGVGAYVTMILLQNYQVAPWYGVWAGVLAALVVALVIGSLCFRLRGPYFVLASIAVAEIMRLTAINLKTLTNGAEGILVTEIPPLVVRGHVLADFSLSKVPYYYLGLALALLTLAVAWAVEHSKLGYYLQAIREDQDAAHSLGIPIARYKNYGLMLSAALTAMTGAFFAVFVGFVDPGTVLGLDISVQIMLICIIGGMGTLWGPVWGALVLIPLAEILRSNLVTEYLVQFGLVSADSRMGLFLKENLSHAHVLIYGILVVLVILFMPEGIMGFVKRLSRRRKEVR